MPRSSACILCLLADGRVDRSVVLEDESCVALMTIEPVNPGHVMIVPREHVTLLGALDDQTWLHVCAIAKRIEQAMRDSGLRCEGTNMFLADGEAAFQEVPHLHLHVFPRFAGDAFKVDADWSHQPSRTELERLDSMIAEAL